MHTITPREYQLDGFEAVISQYRKGLGHALVVLASGLGKTVLAAMVVAWWIRTAPRSKRRVLYIMHMADPLHQFRKKVFEVMLHNLGVTMSTITGFAKGELDADILFTTFQMMRKELRGQYPPDEFGLVVVDEAHHAMAPTFHQVITGLECSFLFGMTATPDRMDGRDIRALFGEEVYSYPLECALAEGRWLADVDYRLMTDNIDMKELHGLVARVRGGDRHIGRKSIDSTIFLPERMEEVVRVVRAARSGGKKTVVFCRSIRHVTWVHEFFPEALPYHSNLSPRTLKRRYDEFEAGRLRTLLVVDKFNEAVDVPDAELLVFLRATDSETIWKQQLGRGLRRTDGKRKVVVLDFVANCERILTVRRLVEGVSRIRMDEEVEVETGWQVHFAEELVDVLQLLEELDQDIWSLRLAELTAFKAEHGHCRVPAELPENPALGAWARNIRSRYHRGQLPQPRIEALNALGFGWGRAYGPQTSFETRLAELTAFKAEHGHCDVPFGWSQNPGLASWVKTIRRLHHDGDVPPQRIEALNALGFEWGRTLAEHFETRLAELTAFKAEHGHCRVPDRWVENPKLAFWVSAMRQCRRKGRLTQARVDALDGIGFRWVEPTIPFETRLAELTAFKAEHGHCRVPNRWPGNPKLGSWVVSTRHRRRIGRLPQPRIEALNALGFEW